MPQSHKNPLAKAVLSVGLCICAVATGCNSYRFTATYPRENTTVKGRYRIATIKSHIPVTQPIGFVTPQFSVPDPWSIPQVASKIPEETLKSMIWSRYQDIFTTDIDATPIDIEIHPVSEKKSGMWSIFFPYIVSLGTLPAFINTTSECRVEVRPHSSASSANRRLRFSSDMKLTCFTPIGLISYGELPDVREQSFGSGIFDVPHAGGDALNRLNTIAVNAIAYSVVAQLSELESKGATMRKPATIKSKPAVAIDDVINKFEKLQHLRKKGLITEEEFNKIKADILKSIQEAPNGK